MADNTVNDDDKSATKPDDTDAKPAAAPAASKNEGGAKPRGRAKAAAASNGDDAPKAALRRAAKSAPRAAKTDAKPRANDDKPAKAAKPPRSQEERGTKRREFLSSGAFWGTLAAGVGLGIALMLGRKVAVQAPTMLAGDWDKALALEHRAVEKLFDLLSATTNKNTTKRSVLLMQLKHALAKHALQEENAVYPALRDAGMVDGADELNREHGYVKQYLYELENCAKDSDEFLQIVARFRADIDHHVREEEEVLYPQMKAQLGEAANDELTATMNKEGFKLA